MYTNIVRVIHQKESIFIFMLFLFFFPLKTQTSNLVYFFIDSFITEGNIQKVYVFNYTGELKDCLKSLEYRSLTTHFNWFQKYGHRFLLLIPSLVAFIVLLYRKQKNYLFNLFDWLLTIICCFSILNSINLTYILINRYHLFSNSQLIISLPEIIVFNTIGCYIFFKIFGSVQRTQTLLIGVFSFYLSFKIWFNYIGPYILPV